MTVPLSLKHDWPRMHVPLTRNEIASFLEVSPAEVDLLWRLGVLGRSLHCAHRPVPELSYSTVYDVIEYALAAGVLPVKLSKELAALWVSQLAEADEWDRFVEADFWTRVCMMLDTAVDDGLAQMTSEAEKVAAVVVTAQLGLLDLCDAQRMAC